MPYVCLFTLSSQLLTTLKDNFDREPLLRGRRISLARIDAHTSCVSNHVLQLVAPPPEHIDGRLIIRDKHGKPTSAFLFFGRIFVDNAMDLVPSQPFSEAHAMEYFTRAASDALAVGLTSVHNPFLSQKKYSSVRKIQLPPQLYLMGNVNSDDYWGSQIPRLIQHGFDERLTVRSVKLFLDGALGSSGAALLEPYSDDPSTSGIMWVRPEVLAKLVREFSTDGWQVNIHCIGDCANQVVLDIYEDILANASFCIDALRPCIEHAQILTLDDIKRTGKLGGRKSNSHFTFMLSMWNGKCFGDTSLVQMGYIWHMGHGGCPCPSSQGSWEWEDLDVHIDKQGEGTGSHIASETSPPTTSLTIIHSTGLLKAGLFPASISQPQTAFTFDALECKTSASSFFQTLQHLTNNAFPDTVPDQYHELMRESRQWRDLMG
ncbi:amidohydrolase family-domain-containing protein [Suillus cothurnatus]|nr:amidohydrolase family-domain-containing protein [Suillus cothurnatus]